MDTITKLGTILISFVIYQFLFHFLNSWFSAKVFPQFNYLSLEKKIEWNLRMVSTCYLSVLGIFCLYALLFNKALGADLMWDDSSLIAMTIAIGIGYLISALLLFIFYWSIIGDTVHVIQYCTGLCVCCLILFQVEGALAHIVNVYLIRGLSTPFMNQLHFLDILEYSKLSEAYFISGVLAAVMYFLVRIVTIPCFYYFIYCMYGTDDYIILELLSQLFWISSSVVMHITDVIRMIKIIKILVKAVQF